MALLQFAIKGNVQEMLDNFKKVMGGAKKSQKSIAKDTEETNKMFTAQTGMMIGAGAATMGMFWGMAKLSPLVSSYLTQFGDAIGYIMTMIFEGLLPVLEPLMDALYEFGQWVSEQPTWLKQFMAVLILIPPAIMAIVAAKAAWSVATGALSGALTFLAANPIVLIIAGIAALVLAIAYLYTHWDDVVKFFEDTWDRMMENQFFASFVNAIGAIVDVLKLVAETIWGALKSAWDWVQTNIGDNWIFQLLVNSLTITWEMLKLLAGVIWDTLVGAWNGLMSAIQPFVDFLTFLWNLDFGAIWDGIVSGLSSLADGFVDFISQAWDWGVDMIQNFIDGILSMVGAVGDAAEEVWNGVTNWLGFDLPKNDRMAMKFGADFSNYFSEGMALNGVSGAAKSLQGDLTGAGFNGSGGGSNSTINVTITGNSISNQLDLNDIARQVSNQIRTEIARGI